jgi:hypothetical protein
MPSDDGLCAKCAVICEYRRARIVSCSAFRRIDPNALSALQHVQALPDGFVKVASLSAALSEARELKDKIAKLTALNEGLEAQLQTLRGRLATALQENKQRDKRK